ncbi:DUF2815 family protein [Candidatus Liberibacter asiaticus]|uniref:ssDNA-binding protein n=1 Tax=Liberibacter asiaticus TaxID=34021 RepID=UPI001867EA4A|nr:DUF2815 family protein [Candidatus Liberibacter asiaticus]
MAKVLIKGRLSYPQLHEPRAYGDKGDEVYSADILFSKTDNEQCDKLEQAIREAGEEKFGGSNMAALIERMKRTGRYPLKDGDQKISTSLKPEAYEVYAGQYYITPKNKKVRPRLVDRHVQEVTENIQEVFYSGCHVNAIISVYAYTFQGTKGVTFTLTGVQFVKDDTRWGGQLRASSSDFESYEEETASIDELEEMPF